MNTKADSIKGRGTQWSSRGLTLVITLGLFLLVLLPAMAQAQFTYTTNNGEITITKYVGPGGEVTVPSAIDGRPVTSIGESAFRECMTVTSITIPEIVNVIGDSSFYYCTNLTNAVMSPESIGRGAFYGCSKLSNVEFGGTRFGIIKQDAFRDCLSLRKVSFPRSVQWVDSGAFAHCVSLTNVTFPTNSYCHWIGVGAFQHCYDLTDFDVPSQVTTIQQDLFAYCRSLQRITIPQGVTHIYIGAFNRCTNLGSVEIPEGVIYIGQAVFVGCTGLTNIVLPNSVSTVDNYAFSACTNLSSVTLGRNLWRIGYSAFGLCPSLKTILVDSLNPHYSSVDGVLFDKIQTSLIAWPGGKAVSYTIPDSVTSIGFGAFMDCFTLRSVTLPNSVTNIGMYAFSFCTELSNVSLGNRVESILNSAFDHCYNLWTLYFLGNAPELAGDPFWRATNAVVYYLPNTIGWGATFGGRPTALWVEVPALQRSPETQTAEVGADVQFHAYATNSLPLLYRWYRNGGDFLNTSTNGVLLVANLQLSQAGTYTAVISNALGSVTSAPAMLNVISPVERRLVPGLILTAQSNTLLNVEYRSSVLVTQDWESFPTLYFTNGPQYFFDLSSPLPPQRFYRASQAAPVSMTPTLGLQMIPALTLTGSAGDRIRVDGINQYGPTDAWFTLATVTLTNTSRLYFDVTAPGQPARLYRLVPLL